MHKDLNLSFDCKSFGMPLVHDMPLGQLGLLLVRSLQYLLSTVLALCC